jgi:hypothetical protein
MGGTSRYSIIQANGGGTPGYNFNISYTNGFVANNSGTLQTVSQPGTTGIDYLKITGPNNSNKYFYSNINTTGIQNIFNQAFGIQIMGAEFPYGTGNDPSNILLPPRAAIAAAGGPSTNGDYTAYAGGSTPNYSGGSGGAGSTTNGAGGGGGGAGWLGAGGNGNVSNSANVTGNGGAGGAGGGGGGGGGLNYGNLDLSSQGGAGGNGAIILYY